MNNFRKWIKLVESERPSNRIWIGPSGQIIDCTVEDMSHSACVMAYPEKFNLDSKMLKELAEYWDSIDEEFDFDYVISLAEQRGWVRVSTDETYYNENGTVALTGAVMTYIHRAAKFLIKNGYVIHSLNIENIVGDRINQRYFEFNPESLNLFVEKSRLPLPTNTHSIPVSLPPRTQHTEHPKP